MKLFWVIIESKFVQYFVPGFLIFIVLQESVFCYPYRKLQTCSNRLENALEQMRRKNFQIKSKRLNEAEYYTPYRMYHTLYAQNEDLDEDFYHIQNERKDYAKSLRRKDRSVIQKLYTYNRPDNLQLPNRQPHKLIIDRVDVEELQVKLPSIEITKHWVQVDKCKFNSENATLDTRLIFPDLMLSGKVIIQPSGGKCNMILRLRRAGIDFHTKPIGLEGNEESRRLFAASVRTDSHFAEPGFISVFAHSCEGPTGIKIRRNSKRRFSFNNGYNTYDSMPTQEEFSFNIGRNQVNNRMNFSTSKTQGSFPNGRILRTRIDNFHVQDEVDFNDDVLYVSDDVIQDIVQPDARTFANVFSNKDGGGDRVNDALINELEKLFSMGVRGLLTTYMQKALQPAIKETLMENMGFTISYG